MILRNTTARQQRQQKFPSISGVIRNVVDGFEIKAESCHLKIINDLELKNKTLTLNNRVLRADLKTAQSRIKNLSEELEAVSKRFHGSENEVKYLTQKLESIELSDLSNLKYTLSLLKNEVDTLIEENKKMQKKVSQYENDEQMTFEEIMPVIQKKFQNLKTTTPKCIKYL